MTEIIGNQYHLEVTHISEQEGGWAALAYRVDTKDKCYFLKAYPKNRTSTAKWVKSIDAYVPILFLLNDTEIADKIIKPLRTAENTLKCEDDESIYLLFEYIEGNTIGDAPLNEGQVDELSEIISFLHHFSKDVSYDFSDLKEDFSIPFNDMLKEYLSNENNHVFHDINERIDRYRSEIQKLVLELDVLSEKMKKARAQFVLCHTDINNWNLMQTEKGLVLIDWEGLKYAPPEADLFCMYDDEYFDKFLKHYRERNCEYVIDFEMLRFYQLRRKSEDIWEFIEQLAYDSQSVHDRNATLAELENELCHMSRMATIPVE